ncbi:hypothetical protein OOU_Y34scaffold00283g78 [Pyricularia oryzae Y34]|uniref:Uncharacterized protein n=2 Tax=Pyricularia oryzae TaxID=318829 RepID=A0AA97P3M8_PYRO3|nr:hypothetical protein OOU_Y34scaffold00283g78 [Pyricularia oryzae Y34]
MDDSSMPEMVENVVKVVKGVCRVMSML